MLSLTEGGKICYLNDKSLLGAWTLFPGSPLLSTLVDLFMCASERSWRKLNFFSKTRFN